MTGERESLAGRPVLSGCPGSEVHTLHYATLRSPCAVIEHRRMRSQSACDDRAVDPIAVSDHVTGSPVPRKGLGYLTCNPLCCRVGCDADPREVPPLAIRRPTRYPEALDGRQPRPDFDQGAMLVVHAEWDPDPPISRAKDFFSRPRRAGHPRGAPPKQRNAAARCAECLVQKVPEVARRRRLTGVRKSRNSHDLAGSAENDLPRSPGGPFQNGIDMQAECDHRRKVGALHRLA
jgi:hypothetical protein